MFTSSLLKLSVNATGTLNISYLYNMLLLHAPVNIRRAIRRAFQFSPASLCEGRPTPEKWVSMPCRAEPDTAYSPKRGGVKPRRVHWESLWLFEHHPCE